MHHVLCSWESSGCVSQARGAAGGSSERCVRCWEKPRFALLVSDAVSQGCDSALAGFRPGTCCHVEQQNRLSLLGWCLQGPGSQPAAAPLLPCLPSLLPRILRTPTHPGGDRSAAALMRKVRASQCSRTLSAPFFVSAPKRFLPCSSAALRCEDGGGARLSPLLFLANFFLTILLLSLSASAYTVISSSLSLWYKNSLFVKRLQPYSKTISRTSSF